MKLESVEACLPIFAYYVDCSSCCLFIGYGIIEEQRSHQYLARSGLMISHGFWLTGLTILCPPASPRITIDAPPCPALALSKPEANGLRCDTIDAKVKFLKKSQISQKQ